MSRQISVSNEVYELLSKGKEKKLFTGYQGKSMLGTNKSRHNELCRAMKDEKQKLELLKAKITAERKANYGSMLCKQSTSHS